MNRRYLSRIISLSIVFWAEHAWLALAVDSPPPTPALNGPFSPLTPPAVPSPPSGNMVWNTFMWVLLGIGLGMAILAITQVWYRRRTP